MTTSISLEQSTIILQSLAELIYRAGVLCQHIDELEAQTETLSKYTSSLKALSEEKRRFEPILQNYETTLRGIIKGVSNA